MSKKKFNNDALNLQLRISSEITELLKSRGVNVSELNVKLQAIKKQKKGVSLKAEDDIVVIEGQIFLKINSILNEKTSQYKFSEDEDEDELLDDDFISKS